MEITRRRIGELGGEFAQHSEVVAGFERCRGDQRNTASFVQRVFELSQTVGGVDVDEDQSGLSGGELSDHPLGVVRRPHADTVTASESEGQQAGGKGVDPILQLMVFPADMLVPDDQCIPLAKALDDLIEMDTDRIAYKRSLAGTVDIAQQRHIKATSRYSEL